MPVSVAGPETLMLAPKLPVALVTVNVVLMVAAGAAAHTSSAKAKVENVGFIGLSESSTLETQEFGETWFTQHSAGPLPAGWTLRVYLWYWPPVYLFPAIFGRVRHSTEVHMSELQSRQ